ncbi:MAG: hypothetical protein LUE29_12510 [Lachnospiraceae bacterium]|nr:hypothetical protein [Lachnospiraceae bacterium]
MLKKQEVFASCFFCYGKIKDEDDRLTSSERFSGNCMRSFYVNEAAAGTAHGVSRAQYHRVAKLIRDLRICHD